MILKLIGAVMICAACTYIGIKKSGELKGRYKSLRNIGTALGYLETEIGFCSNDLKRAFINIDRGTDTCGLFKDAADKIEEYGIKKAWAYAVLKSSMPILDSDRELMLMLGEKLGMTDTKSQLKHIGYVKELVNAQSESAESEYGRLGKIYRSGGLLAGLFIILVIM